MMTVSSVQAILFKIPSIFAADKLLTALDRNHNYNEINSLYHIGASVAEWLRS
jgi:hypothetical protein